jgi:hypothetical protein
MASPHVAGAGALLQAHPNTPAQAGRDIRRTALIPKLWAIPALFRIVSIARCRYAHIDDAILSTTKITPPRFLR